MREAKTCRKTIMILTGLILVSGLIIFWKFIFGNQILAYTDIGSDTYDQYLMSYQTIINHLKTGNFSLWDFKNGYGSNLYAMNLYDPFLIMIYITGVLFSAEKIYGLLVWLQILRMVLAGLFLYGFLSCFRLMEKSKLIAAYMYALCGYLVIWGQHYQFGTVVVLFPLLLWMAEKSLRQWSCCFGLALVCALECACSLYFSYMQFVVLGFYILFRIAWDGKLFSKTGICQTGKTYGFMVLGIGMGMFSLLPSAFQIFGVSGRMEGKPLLTRVMEALCLYPEAYYETLGKKFLSGNLEGINAYSGYMNIYESPNIFLSVLFVLAAAQFMMLMCSKHYSRKQKILLLLAVAAGAFVLLIPLGSMIFNGFSYPFSRHTFLYLPFFAWMTAEVLHQSWDKGKVNFLVLLISGIAVTGVYLGNYMEKRNRLPLALGILSVAIVAAWVGSIYLRRRKMRQMAYAGLVAAVMISMSGDAYYSYNCQRAILEKEPSAYFDELYNESIEDALSLIREQDDSFYRVEKDYTTGTSISCLNSMAQNYNGVSTYNSVINAGVGQYLQEFWPNLQIMNSTHFSFANAVQDDFQASFSNVKYVLSKKQDLHVPGYELWQQCGDIYIHRNMHTDGLGKFYTKAFTEKAYEAVKATTDREALLSANVLCDTVPSLIRQDSDMEKYAKSAVASDEQITQITSDGFDAILQIPAMSQNDSEKYILEFDLIFDTFISEINLTVGSNTTTISAGPEAVHVSLSVPSDIHEVRIHQDQVLVSQRAVITNKRLYMSQVQDLTSLSEGIHFNKAERDSRISGTAQVNQDGILMMTIPYEDGWCAFVDGEKVDIHRVNYGFSGIYLEKGSHSIQIEYHCPGFASGVICSICCLVLMILIGVIAARKERVEL
ncbi:MAG: YfhO family protein [Eubacterium sp.]|nr:YfhO family protein [Eubacterium sp.]